MFSLRKNKVNIGEIYKSLRINIEYPSKNKNIKTICIISPESSEGKSTIASSLSISFSKSYKKTLLIDWNLRKPECQKIFNLKNEQGLLDIFYKEKDIDKVIFKYNSYLDILLTGGITNNDIDIIESKKIDELLQELKKQYDYILIDTPEFNLYTDAKVLSQKVDGTILVASVDQTKIESLVKVKKILDKMQTNILGIVLNKASKYFINN